MRDKEYRKYFFHGHPAEPPSNNIGWAIEQLNAGKRIRAKDWPPHCLFIRLDGPGHITYGPKINFYSDINNFKTIWWEYNWQAKDLFWTKWELA